MAVVITMFLVFFILGIVFMMGKGGPLIAGYNTADREDKEKYDEKRLNKCFSAFCFGMAVVIGVSGYVNTERFALHVGLPLILLLLLFLVIASGTYCKKK